MLVRSSLIVAAVVALAACSSSKSSPAAAAPDDGGTADSGSTASSYALKYTTAPGQETHWCEYKKMPKSAGGEVLVSGVDWSWKAAHHWGLYRLVPTAPLAELHLDAPFDCFSPAGAMQYAQFSTSFLQGEAKGSIEFPAGTALSFASEEVVLFQTHSINTGGAPTTSEVDVSFRVADAAAVNSRLGLIQFYDPYIVVPAHADAVAQMRCKVPQDITLVRSTTHEHSRGTKVQTFLDAPDGTKAKAPFLTSTNWDLPAIRDDQVKVTRGQYIRTVCQYKGDEHPLVTQGQFKGDKEMCMTIAYYYPAIQDPGERSLFENCVQTPFLGKTGPLASFGDSFGSGSVACDATLKCVQGVVGKDPSEAPRPHDGQIDVGPNFQKCVVDSCPTASSPLFTMLTCVQQNCQAACADPAKCQPCVIDKCSTELSACTSHACGE